MGEALNVMVGRKPSQVAEALADAKTHLEDPAKSAEPADQVERLVQKFRELQGQEGRGQVGPEVRQAILAVNRDWLADLLQLPAGSKILGATSDPADPWNIRLVLAHPELRPVAPGQPLPLCQPSYRETRVEKNVGFVSWGQ